MASAWGAPAPQSAIKPQKGDVRVTGGDQPTDGIQCVRWSPTQGTNFVASISWDKSVLIWNVGTTQQDPKRLITPFVGGMKAASPPLDLCWKHDSTTLYFGCCDNRAYAWAPKANRCVAVAQHDAPIRRVRWIAEHSVLVTAGWDGKIKYWDTRTQNAVREITLRERIYGMDACFPFMAACTAGTPGQLSFFDMRQTERPLYELPSPLKMQVRCLAVFPTTNIQESGVVLGSVEGRVAIRVVDPSATARTRKDFAFKCHRDANHKVYPVNDVAFHEYGTFVTVGGDGMFNFWDKNVQQRLRAYGPVGLPISSCAINSGGSWMAYSVSYDWHRGKQVPPNAVREHGIFLHALTPKDVKPR